MAGARAEGAAAEGAAAEGAAAEGATEAKGPGGAPALEDSAGAESGADTRRAAAGTRRLAAEEDAPLPASLPHVPGLLFFLCPEVEGPSRLRRLAARSGAGPLPRAGSPPPSSPIRAGSTLGVGRQE